jgi:hypothetical protein
LGRNREILGGSQLLWISCEIQDVFEGDLLHLNTNGTWMLTDMGIPAAAVQPASRCFNQTDKQVAKRDDKQAS